MKVSRRHGQSRGGEGLVVGIAIGVALGAAMGNIGVGIAIGAGIGMALGAGQRARRPKSSPPNKGESDTAARRS